MIDSQGQQDVLNGILQVLQRIETKLETHEARVEAVEDLIRRNHSSLAASSETSHQNSKHPSDVSWHEESDHSFISRSWDLNQRQIASVETQEKTRVGHEAFSVYSRGGPRIPYSEWRSAQSEDNLNNPLDEDYHDMLTQYLGHCAVMPKDGRLPLNFTWAINPAAPKISKTTDVLIRARTLEGEALRTFDADQRLTRTRMLRALHAFDEDHRTQSGNDFLVVDLDSFNNSRIYRVGEEAIGSELMVSAESTHEAPWSRLM
ncbi:MAG: hypothetical protein Q9201_006045 [Fulgogasparrea decipioides]